MDADPTPQQLRRAAEIKEKLNDLNKELRRLVDGSSSNGAASGKKRDDERGGEKENCGGAARTMGEAQESDIRLSPPQALPLSLGWRLGHVVSFGKSTSDLMLAKKALVASCC